MDEHALSPIKQAPSKKEKTSFNLKKKDQTSTHQLENYTTRLNNDLSSAQIKLLSLESSHDSLLREHQHTMQSLVNLQAQYRASLDQAAKAREELGKAMAGIRQKQNQMLHESRRKDKEMDKLKIKVNRVLREKMRGVSVVLEEGTVVREEEQESLSLAREMFLDFEEKVQVLVRENEYLRECLNSLYQGCTALIPRDEGMDGLFIHEECFGLAIDWIGVREKIDQLVGFIEPLSLVEDGYHARGEEIKELKLKIEDYR